MRRVLASVAVTAAALATSVAGMPVVAQAATSSPTAPQRFVVEYAAGASADGVAAAIRQAGGTVVSHNEEVGFAVATSRNQSFVTDVSAAAAVDGAARNSIIGEVPKEARPARADIERLEAERAARAGQDTVPPKYKRDAGEPLSPLQWDMRQINATTDGSYAVQPGDKRVLVGVIDTGVDGRHPDIRANFNKDLSRNFVTDIPYQLDQYGNPILDEDGNPVVFDGPCEFSGCVDPVFWDDDGHGTHVASTIAAPVNSFGIAGVAPNVTLVNIRAGHDSGYFFLEDTVQAITYAGEIGVDVINMSFYVDPWLFNCDSNPADSRAAQIEQRTTKRLVQRAINFAAGRGTLSVSSAGNSNYQYGTPVTDTSSPDYPEGAAYPRDIDPATCKDVPAQLDNVLTVSATGPSSRKAYYSNYGQGDPSLAPWQIVDVAAPGGDYYDQPDNHGSPVNLVLAAYPRNVALANGDVDEKGNVTPGAGGFVIKECKATGLCAYYQYLQGTSMASPHAAGVAALVVSEYGQRDPRHPEGLRLAPSKTAAVVAGTAREHACPDPRTVTYTRISASGTVRTSQATCEGDPAFNGFYGYGIVNALAAVTAVG